MSSHREAPEISQDPAADNTDVYAFVSPDRPSFVTIIANFLPLQQPYGGPNFYEFSDDVRYRIHIANNATAESDIIYQFEFRTEVRNPNSFLYNTGPIDSIDSENWNRPQFYKATRIEGGQTEVFGQNLPVPPVNVGVRSTPNYSQLAEQATVKRKGTWFFCGQRADAFNVDLGSIFDLGALRPFNEAHLIPMAAMDGVNSVQACNVHTIAIQVPISRLTRYKNEPSNRYNKFATLGIWATAERRTSTVIDPDTGTKTGTGPYRQVSRLGNPLVNEVLIPMGDKDRWNAGQPSADRRFRKYVDRPELAKLLPVLYPDVFPNLQAYDKPRADLNAILHTGIPKGVVDDFQNFTGPTQADMLRLNVAIPPTQPGDQSRLGIIGGDLAGFPNGRRVNDDIVAIELRAVAGATIPLVDPDYEPDDAATQLTDGTQSAAPGTNAFPYLQDPSGGYQTRPGTVDDGGDQG
ncbi:DUF4331 domain-containing protein [Nocardioides sp. CFH 31398]|uniref:DUF4331 domain-containing protein n=1 Tax=Nocardioides sp. CFH 31398 TaxID=2919579 RepID=UPI001F064993|nr:DUF4331 domain-containing protein [Nocardioides sp. CFH 31398]MCH1867710.1 DUF4331 domain-containing protein [Nocardioides sp. CFH 31398]